MDKINNKLIFAMVLGNIAGDLITKVPESPLRASWNTANKQIARQPKKRKQYILAYHWLYH